MSPYELVDSVKAAFPVGVLCEAVGVSRSAYYAPNARQRWYSDLVSRTL